MTPEVTVAVPILDRPDRIPVVMRRFAHPSVEVLFLPDPDDDASLETLERLAAPYSIAPAAPAFGVPTYATKINHAYRITSAPFLLYAADDVLPQAGWWERARAHLEDPRVGLLATNDQHHYLVKRGLLATHGIVRRSYVERHGTASLPDAGPIMHDGYRHWCCDCEISYVARSRNAFRYAPNVILRHQHPHARRGVLDATYQLGRGFAERDRALRDQRLPAWP